MEPGNTRPEDLPLPPSPSTPAVQEITDDTTRSEQASLEDTGSTSNGDGDTDATSPATTDCGCYSPIQGHLDGFKKFENNINATLQKLPRVQVKYDRVRVLVVYWDKSDVSQLSENAEKLKTMFESDYGFETDSHVLENGNHKIDIPVHNKVIRKKFLKKLTETTDSIDEVTSPTDEKTEVNNLLILYYGGHGANLKTTGKPEKVWQPTRKSKTMLEWQGLQQELREIDCDVLFLFDCCYAIAMVDAEKPWKRRCEILAASGAADEASAKPESSFTGAIIEELKKPERANSNSMDVLWFHTLMTSTEIATNYNLRPSPQWKRYSGPLYQTSISLESKKTTAVEDMANQPGKNPATPNAKAITHSIDELSSLSDTRMLIKVKFFNAAEPLLEEDWMKWFRLRPSNIASGGIEIAIVPKAILQKIRCEGVFKSDSSLVLFSVPIWLWNNMAPDPACEALGVVRSENLLPKMASNPVQITAAASKMSPVEQREGEDAAEEKETILQKAELHMRKIQEAGEEKEIAAREEIAQKRKDLEEKAKALSIREESVVNAELARREEWAKMEDSARTAQREDLKRRRDWMTKESMARDLQRKDEQERRTRMQRTQELDRRDFARREEEFERREEELARRTRALTNERQLSVTTKPLPVPQKSASRNVPVVVQAKMTVNLPSWTGYWLGQKSLSEQLPDAFVKPAIGKRTRGLDRWQPGVRVGAKR